MYFCSCERFLVQNVHQLPVARLAGKAWRQDQGATRWRPPLRPQLLGAEVCGGDPAGGPWGLFSMTSRVEVKRWSEDFLKGLKMLECLFSKYWGSRAHSGKAGKEGRGSEEIEGEEGERAWGGI